MEIIKEIPRYYNLQHDFRSLRAERNIVAKFDNRRIYLIRLIIF